MALQIQTLPDEARAPLLGTGFNLEQGLWSCPDFQPLLKESLLDPFRPALARVDAAMLPAAPPDLSPQALTREVYQSVLASEPYSSQWQMLRELDQAGVRILLGVWGGPEQFTDDGTRRGELLPEYYDGYVEYVVSVVDFLVNEQHLPIWAITIANEPDGGDGNQISPDGFTYIAHQLALQLRPYGVELYGPDTTNADAAMDYLPQLLADPVITDQLAFVGFHQYYADAGLADIVDYVHATRPDLPVVVTEYTSFNYGDLDAGQEASDPLDFTLEIADTVLAHYRLGADAALYWDAVDYLQPGHTAITRWGLLQGPAEDFAPRDWYFGLGQILPYLQPGAEVLDTQRSSGDDLGILAIRTVDDHVALFLVNQNETVYEVQLNLRGPAEDRFSITRTDANALAAPAGSISVSGGSARLEIPGRSITTLVGY